MINSCFWRHDYVSRVGSEHCGWSTENMRQHDLKLQFQFFCAKLILHVNSATLHFSQFKTPKQIESSGQNQMATCNEIYNIEKVLVFKKNVFQAVEFMNINSSQFCGRLQQNSWKWRFLDSSKSL